MRFTTCVILGFVLLILVLPSVSAARPALYAWWTATPPSVDGAFSQGEWSNPQIVFDAPAYPVTYILPTYVYLVNDASNLYVMVDAVGDNDDDAGDECLMWFNYGGAGTALNKVRIEGKAGTEIASPFHAVVGFGSSPNGAGNHKIYEFSIPLTLLNTAPGQPIDFCSPMEKFGSISYDATGGRDNIWPLELGTSLPGSLDSWGLLYLSTSTSATAPVGGVVMPANTFPLLAPWLAVIGLVGCVGALVVVAKKRR